MNWSTRSISKSGILTQSVWNHSSQLSAVELVFYELFRYSPIACNHHSVFVIPRFAYAIEFVILFITVVYIWLWDNIIRSAWDDRSRTRPGVNVYCAFRNATF